LSCEAGAQGPSANIMLEFIHHALGFFLGGGGGVFNKKKSNTKDVTSLISKK
jgi:hypothetical protein